MDSETFSYYYRQLMPICTAELWKISVDLIPGLTTCQNFDYRLPDKDFGLRHRSESSTTCKYVRLSRIPPSGLAKIVIWNPMPARRTRLWQTG